MKLIAGREFFGMKTLVQNSLHTQIDVMTYVNKIAHVFNGSRIVSLCFFIRVMPFCSQFWRIVILMFAHPQQIQFVVGEQPAYLLLTNRCICIFN